jgi:hypothetical protein
MAEADQTATEQETENQTTSTDWRDGLADDVKETVSRFKTEPDLAQGYHELLKLDSVKVKIPDENASDEDRAKFYTKLGRPETPEAYQVKRPELPDGMPYDEKLEGHIKHAAHQAGLNQAQVSHLSKVYNDYQVEQWNAVLEENEKLNTQRTEKLKQDWGEDKYRENVELAKRAFGEIAPQVLKDLMTADDIEADPILLEMYSTIWRKTLDSPLIKGEQATAGDWKPDFPKSPEMYEDDPQGKKYFEGQGYDYATKRWRGR